MDEQYKSYTIKNNGMKVELLNLGAIMQRILIQHDGKEIDVVLGFDEAEDYSENSGTYFGAVVGRNANRIENSELTLDGQTYKLEANDGAHNLHSGSDGFNQRIWDVEDHQDSCITFSLVSPHLDQGFPGELKMEVTYELTGDQTLEVTYKGSSNKLTVFNPTNHSYFNLNGHHSGDVRHHQLWLNSDRYSELDEDNIPAGRHLEVKNTTMDFTTLTTVSEDESEEYDNNFILNSSDINDKTVILIGNQTGIQLDFYTNSPCLQLYTGNGLDSEQGKDGAVYHKHAGICLEPQYEPNSIHSEHPPLIDGVKEYKSVYRFTTK